MAGLDIVLMFDGICEEAYKGGPRNPGGVGAWGYVLWLGTKKKLTGSGNLGNPEWMSNNYAEYCALGFGLKRLKDLDLPQINSLTILGDSMLIVNQVNGTFATNSEKLIPLKDKCVDYLKGFPVQWVLRWIPRDINAEADELSRVGYKFFLEKKESS